MLGLRRVSVMPNARPIATSLERLGVVPAIGLDLYITMTLLLLLLYSGNTWQVGVPLTALCIVAFVLSPLRQSAKLWFVIALLVSAGTYQSWYVADNHEYLIAYWCLAMFVALQTQRPEVSLAVVARWLIGLSFLFAVFWKIVSPDYLNSAFFHHALLLDDRFAGISRSLGGLTLERSELNSAAVRALLSYDSTLRTVQMQSTAAIDRLAQFITWWTIAIEVLVTVAFLGPKSGLLYRWRDYFLLLFVLSTYSVAPVIGFGWVLVIMGLAQSERRYHLPLLYLGAFLALQVYRFPWSVVF